MFQWTSTSINSISITHIFVLLLNTIIYLYSYLCHTERDVSQPPDCMKPCTIKVITWRCDVERLRSTQQDYIGGDHKMAGLIMDPPVSPTQHMSLITATDQSDQRSEVTGMVALGNLTTEQDGNGTNFTVPLDSMVSLHYGLPSMIVVAVVLFVVIVITAFGNFLVGLALFKYRW